MHQPRFGKLFFYNGYVNYFQTDEEGNPYGV